MEDVEELLEQGSRPEVDPFLVIEIPESDDSVDSDEESDIDDEEAATPRAPYAYNITVDAPDGTRLLDATIESDQSRSRKRKRDPVPDSERKRRRKLSLRERVEEQLKKPYDSRRNTPGDMSTKFPNQSFSITAESTT